MPATASKAIMLSEPFSVDLTVIHRNKTAMSLLLKHRLQRWSMNKERRLVLVDVPQSLCSSSVGQSWMVFLNFHEVALHPLNQAVLKFR